MGTHVALLDFFRRSPVVGRCFVQGLPLSSVAQFPVQMGLRAVLSTKIFYLLIR